MNSSFHNSTEFHSILNVTSIEVITIQSTGTLPGIMSAEVYNALVILIARFILPLTEIFGLISNTINIIVFWSMGLNDSVTSSFFALSLSDWCYLMASLIGWMSSLVGLFAFQDQINLHDLSYIGVWYSLMFSAMSVFLTTYIAAQRCFCVALPLKFKGFFTTRRNLLILSLICIVSVALHVPILSKMGLKSYFDSTTNTSRVAIWYADDWSSLITIKDILVGLWLPVFTQILIIICMFILIAALRESSKFRQFASSANSQDAKNKSNRKEVQIVKAVIMVTLISIICNMAPICQAVVRRVVKGFAIYQRFSKTFYVVVLTKHTFQHLNASFNIFVYLRFNSTYRNTFKRIMFRTESKK